MNVASELPTDVRVQVARSNAYHLRVSERLDATVVVVVLVGGVDHQWKSIPLQDDQRPAGAAGGGELDLERRVASNAE